MISMPRAIRHLVLGILSVLMLCTRSLCAEDVTIRHEITPAFSWSSYEYSQDDYIINDAAFPLISGRYESEYQQYSLFYSFFFTPISDDPQIPVGLQQFYAHPAALKLHLNIRPEYEASRIFQNQETAYRTSTSYTPQSRNAGLELEVYPWQKTGMTFSLDSTKSEEQLSLSNTLGRQTSGNSDEIQQKYGFGLLQYLGENIRLAASGALFDGEIVSAENSWDEESSLVQTGYDVETDSEGQEFRLSGAYIFRKFFCLSGGYRYYNSTAHSVTKSSHYGAISTGESFYDDETKENLLHASIDVYWKKNSSLRLGGKFRRYELERIYGTDQNVLYAWDIWSFTSTLSHYITRHFGVWLSYEFTMRDGSVETWHPEAEGDPRTTYQTSSELHTIQVGVNIGL